MAVGRTPSMPMSEHVVAWGPGLLALLAVGTADQLTGPEVGFYVFYFVPVAIVAWRVGMRAAVGMAVVATAVWLAVDVSSGRVYSSQWIHAWNTFVRFSSFIVIGVAVARVGELLGRARALNADLSRALGEVRQLSGLLPICASCHKIRNDDGYWERVENYISDRSEADFTHSICPACTEKLFPDDQSGPGEGD